MKHTVFRMNVDGHRIGYDLSQYASGPEADPESHLGRKNLDYLNDMCDTITDYFQNKGVDFSVKIVQQYNHDM